MRPNKMPLTHEILHGIHTDSCDDTDPTCCEVAAKEAILKDREDEEPREDDTENEVEMTQD